MTEVRRILQVARTDLSYFFRTKWLMAVLLSLNLSDMLVIGLVYSGLMKGGLVLNYFQFFAPAVVVMGLFMGALDTGRRIWLAFREGVIQYYLSLPISNKGLVAAYLIAGSVSAMIYSVSLLLVALIVLPTHAILNALAVLPFLFILAMGLAGIAAALAALASTHGEFFFAFQQIVQAFLLTFSTVYYPRQVMELYLPSILVTVASANPLSNAAEALREFVFKGSPIQPSVMISLTLTSVPFALIGALVYYKALQNLQVKGKL
jgi:ABC-type polysaccharide/polyol phosphate export permease